MRIGPAHTPQVIKTLLIVNAVVYLGQLAGMVPSGLLGASAAGFWYGHFIWQPFTYMFLHSAGSPMHILFNMFFLWMFGSDLVQVWGEKRFLRFYLICGFGAGLLIVTFPMLLLFLGVGVNLSIPTIGASGAIYGVLTAVGLLWPDRTIMLMFPPIPFRAIWLVPILFVTTLLFDSGNTVSHIGHLGGVLVAIGLLVGSGESKGGGGLNLESLKFKWRRFKMRRRLRAVQVEERRDRDRYH